MLCLVTSVLNMPSTKRRAEAGGGCCRLLLALVRGVADAGDGGVGVALLMGSGRGVPVWFLGGRLVGGCMESHACKWLIRPHTRTCTIDAITHICLTDTRAPLMPPIPCTHRNTYHRHHVSSFIKHFYKTRTLDALDELEPARKVPHDPQRQGTPLRLYIRVCG